jgi:photosystem II stability/assembly factor-like uncharacterized protein
LVSPSAYTTYAIDYRGINGCIAAANIGICRKPIIDTVVTMPCQEVFLTAENIRSFAETQWKCNGTEMFSYTGETLKASQTGDYTASVINSGIWVSQGKQLAMRAFTNTTFVNNNFGVAISTSETIIRTVDGGTSWSVCKSPTTKSLDSITMVNTAVGFIFGTRILLKTTDGALTWQKVKADTSGSFGLESFSNEQDGFCLRNYDIIRTPDGGVNWKLVYNGGYYLCKVKTFSNNRVYAIGWNGEFIRSTNDGISWQQVTLGTSQYLQDIDFTDSNNGIIIGNNTLLKTTDGGLTWTDIAFESGGSNYNNVQMISPQVIVLSSYSAIYITTNGGQSWKSVDAYSNVREQILNYYFFDENAGVAASNYTISKISTRSENWSIVNQMKRLNNAQTLELLTEETAYAVTNGVSTNRYFFCER